MYKGPSSSTARHLGGRGGRTTGAALFAASLLSCSIALAPSEELVSEAYDAFARGMQESLVQYLGPVTWDGRHWDEGYRNSAGNAFAVFNTST